MKRPGPATTLIRATVESGVSSPLPECIALRETPARDGFLGATLLSRQEKSVGGERVRQGQRFKTPAAVGAPVLAGAVRPTGALALKAKGTVFHPEVDFSRAPDGYLIPRVAYVPVIKRSITKTGRK